jgi:Raf kinase inhibitor-like YbhB/YbcL family protein
MDTNARPTNRGQQAWLLAMLAGVALLVSACGEHKDDGTFALWSPVISEGGAIASRFTCDGPGNSPPLAWRNAPAGVKSFTLIVEDADSGKGHFVYWLLYNLPPKTTSLPESPEVWTASFADGLQGKNGLDMMGYTDICPPKGPEMHPYLFELYELNSMLPLKGGATSEQLKAAMQGHVLGEARFTADYSRPVDPVKW